MPSLTPTTPALTSDSHTVGFLAIRSSSSSVHLCPGSRRTVTSANRQTSLSTALHPRSPSQIPAQHRLSFPLELI